MKKILFIGDVVGNAGCDFLADKLGMIKRHYGIDITVVNGENSAQGNGISRSSAQHIIRAGADIITTGNHAFRKKNELDVFDCFSKVITKSDDSLGMNLAEIDFRGQLRRLNPFNTEQLAAILDVLVYHTLVCL